MLGNLVRKGFVLFDDADDAAAKQKAAEEAAEKLAGTAKIDSLNDAVKPVQTLVEKMLPPLIGIVTTVAVIYCIFLGLKLAKAEEPQEREKAKGALKNAIIGYLLIFVLIMVVRVISPTLTNWIGASMGA